MVVHQVQGAALQKLSKLRAVRVRYNAHSSWRHVMLLKARRIKWQRSSFFVGSYISQ